VGHLYTDHITKKDFIIWGPVDLESNDPLLEADNQGPFSGLLLKDILFDGKNVGITFVSTSGLYGESSFRLRLKTLSEDCFKYVSTNVLQQSTSGDPFAQPTNVHNNIENGYGIFAGYSESIFEYLSPKPIITGISPIQGRVGDLITITGENLPIESIYEYVQFNGTPIFAPLRAKTKTKLEVIVPPGATSGRLTFHFGSGSVISPVDFEVIK
jgi:hypothetical protein